MWQRVNSILRPVESKNDPFQCSCKSQWDNSRKYNSTNCHANTFIYWSTLSIFFGVLHSCIHVLYHLRTEFSLIRSWQIEGGMNRQLFFSKVVFLRTLTPPPEPHTSIIKWKLCVKFETPQSENSHTCSVPQDPEMVETLSNNWETWCGWTDGIWHGVYDAFYIHQKWPNHQFYCICCILLLLQTCESSTWYSNGQWFSSQKQHRDTKIGFRDQFAGLYFEIF